MVSRDVIEQHPSKSAKWFLSAASCAFALFVLFVPVRHEVFLEYSEGNPIQRIVLRSRSLLGLKCNGWGARIEGNPVWGGPGEGFYLAPTRPVHVSVRAWPGYSQSLQISPITASQQGTLRDRSERETFRAWFIALLEQQLDRCSPSWEPAQRDCAGLLRFAFHEAWGPHTPEWRDRFGFQGPPPARDPSPSLGGPWRNGFPTPEGWRPFAKGALLRDLACIPLSREISEARPGDLLFFSRAGAHSQPDHAMAFVRPDADGQPMLLYHTGPETSGRTPNEGEVRRVRADELLHHPDPTFRPTSENPAFIGVYRWRVLMDEE